MNAASSARHPAGAAELDAFINEMGSTTRRMELLRHWRAVIVSENRSLVGMAAGDVELQHYLDLVAEAPLSSTPRLERFVGWLADLPEYLGNSGTSPKGR